MAELWTLEEVANYLRVTKKTIYRLLEKDSIPATKVGRQWRFSKASVDAWLFQASVGAVANILVIDDDESTCSLFKDTLREAGQAATTATDAFKGLELVRDQDFDLVFLDLKMPGMDGAELFRKIRLTKPKLPVTVITGYPESELMASALTHGPFSVMRKPFRSSDIVACVESYVRFGKQSQ